jgi:hypothetical protein
LEAQIVYCPNSYHGHDKEAIQMQQFRTDNQKKKKKKEREAELL